MRALVLCSGTGSIDRGLERRGFEVVSVDWCPKFSPTICTDILTWDYKAAFPKDHFQFCWMSPECRMFSIARTTGPPADIAKATALVAKCLEIAEFYGCEWCMENPATGSLKTQPVVQGLPWIDTCYCKYGFAYKKPTRLWHSEGFGEVFRPLPVCCKASPCIHVFVHGVHPMSAQRGANRAKGGGRRSHDNCSTKQLYSIPDELCDEIAQAAETVARD